MPNRPGNDDRSTLGSEQNAGSQNNVGSDSAATPTRGRSNRGFASMDREKQREIASKGGRAAHAKGTAHEFDSTEARDAGRKGGVAVSRNREHMAAIGRRGGEARGHARGQAAAQANTAGAGGAREGSFQNSRAPQQNAGVSSSPTAPISSGERQVAIDNQREGVSTRAVSGTGDKGTSSTTDRRPLSGGQESRSDENFGR